ARRALERGVLDVGVRPFHEDTLILECARGWSHGRRRGVSVHLQAWQVSVGGYWGSVPDRVLRVNSIELAVFRIIRIERDGNDAHSIAGFGVEVRKDFWKCDIGRELPGGLVQYVQYAVQIVYKATGSRQRSVRRFRTQRVH